MRLCLSMIVKNEAARIDRCLASVRPYISSVVISDTGSADVTQQKVLQFIADNDFSGDLVFCEFVDFSQARNHALLAAECSGVEYDYLLLVDADMELRVDDPKCFDGLTANAYRLIQRGGDLSYRNTRLVKRGCGARYVGVTHEYLSVPGDTVDLDGAWFVDHMDGANRPEKFARDLRLLNEDIRGIGNANPRSHFYLGQTLRDMGHLELAAEAYVKRAEMGGWEEEVFYAYLQASRCMRTLGA